ncbi:unknown [Clostridium sp. CAG:433]|jgi:hypothetical protein|nr:unknown [Clostridium sp. CAG:433]
MVNFYIKGMSTTNEEQERIINSFKEQGIDVIPVIDDYSNYSIKTIEPSVEKFIEENNPNNEKVNLICHSMGCNFGYLIKRRENIDINKLIFVSPEFVSTTKKEKEEIKNKYKGIDYNNESNNTKLNLHNIILHYKSLRKVMETLTDFVSCNMDTLIIYSKGDIFVSQNWINSGYAFLTDKIEVNSNSHNPLLTNKETYEEISEYIKKPLTLVK